MSSTALHNQPWQLCGWRPYAWRLGRSMELGFQLHPDIPILPALIPGSVQGALRQAGLLPDWNLGTRSLECEWVNNRHWEFFTTVVVPEKFTRAILDADCLDHSGWVLVDGAIAAEFHGSLIRHRLDLSAFLRPGATHVLSVVLDAAPDEQGQIGFTSESRHFKPRFAYSWDWCPRFVTVGIGGALELDFDPPNIEVMSVETRSKDLAGLVEIRTLAATGGTLDVRLTDPAGGVSDHVLSIPEGGGPVQIAIENPELWWPNGEGTQALYRVEIFARQAVRLWEGEVGFKAVQWRPCEGAPPDAEPWICEVNGRPVFLQGVNWTPARLDELSTTDADLETLLTLYRDMGCNLLRVWGGASLESEAFYRMADRFGLMVWQEFPLSSSGLDNWPPESPDVMETLATIATDYVRRRSHHASLIVWCGGNELQHGLDSKVGIGYPCDGSHPCLAMLADVVEREMPGIRYLPTSSTGPRFFANEADFGKGLHHDVHGPWNLAGSWEDWERYWANDDALFRSETGFPGSMTAIQIRHFADGLPDFPPDEKNLYWMHAGAWWRQGKEFAALSDGPRDLETYCDWSRALQARALGVAAAACKARFPRCGGFLVWMGHDCFPCAANTAVIDFERQPKPAYYALQSVFKK